MYSKIKKRIAKFRHWMAYQPPGALTGEGWSSFNKEFRQKAPIRYWFHRDFYRKFVLPIKWKYEHAVNFVRFRTYNRYHVLKTGRAPGYQDPDSNMLHVTFNILKDFVECELAWHIFIGKPDSYKHIRHYWKYTHLSMARHWFREPELGVEYLEWETSLDDPSLPPHERCEDQAATAREILMLYTWWTRDRPGRVEVELVSAREKTGDSIDDIWDMPDRSSERYKQFRESVEARRLQDEAWRIEDTDMLVRLVKIRDKLWS